MDEGLAPLFAIDKGGFGAGFGPCPGGCDGGLHPGDKGFSLGLRVHMCRDKADVFVDVGEGVRGEREDGHAGFEDRGEGFHTVGDAGNDEICTGGKDLLGISCPAVVENVRVSCGQLRKGFEAVFRAGA